MLEVVGSPFISVLSLFDYDIGGRGLVWTVSLGEVGPPAPSATAAFRQLGRNGVPPAVGSAGLLADDVRARPLIGINGRQFGRQSIPFFRGARATPHPLRQFRISMAQAGRFGCAQRPPERRLIVGQFRRRRRGA
jgi:hypothetical protein